jgi:hypothetical protein
LKWSSKARAGSRKQTDTFHKQGDPQERQFGKLG